MHSSLEYSMQTFPVQVDRCVLYLSECTDVLQRSQEKGVDLLVAADSDGVHILEAEVPFKVPRHKGKHEPPDGRIH